MTLKHKVFAYVTNHGRLLLFTHPQSPEAGIQVPAGTVESGETPDSAVMREAFEETGLSDLELTGFLGEQTREMSDYGLDEMHHRYYYHLRCLGSPPEVWRHYEGDASAGSSHPIPFDFFWACLPDKVPKLIADHDAMIPQLLEALSDS